MKNKIKQYLIQFAFTVFLFICSVFLLTLESLIDLVI